MRERNLFDELIQGVEEMRAQREAMFTTGHDAVEDAPTADVDAQALEADALSTDKHLS